MKDFDLKKEMEKKEIDYNSLWDEKDDDEALRKIEDFSKGAPRKGIKGKYIKPKKYVSKNRVNISYGKYIKDVRNEEKEI